ncbi:MAG: glucokinase [Candidatus Dependentiae bacterium]|nr:glucokinase [Candidatus Dependentiae bacterium]
MLTLREVIYVQEVPRNVRAILVGDIGGTNSNFGIFQHPDDGLSLLLSLHAKSQEIVSFSDLVNQVLLHIKDRYSITVHHACFAAAGVVSADRDYSKPTNLDFIIDTQEIVKQTGLSCVFLTNDFEVIGYGLSCINAKDLVSVNHAVAHGKTNKAILGAGTGLGKCIMFWEKDRKMYVPVASEGGHADFAAQSEIEFALVNFLKKTNNCDCNISWEDVLSGTGIKNMYKFFCQYNGAVKPNDFLAKGGLHPDEIFNSRTIDEHAWHTFDFYAHFYARCAKNFALDSLSRGGIYIAGGIAAKNLQLFQQESFLNEFINCGKQKDLLKNIPIYVITDYNVSLYGAAEYMRLEGLCG